MEQKVRTEAALSSSGSASASPVGLEAGRDSYKAYDEKIGGLVEEVGVMAGRIDELQTLL